MNKTSKQVVIFISCLFSIIIFFLIKNYIKAQDALDAFRLDGKVSRIEMHVVHCPFFMDREINIVDKSLLDSINISMQKDMKKVSTSMSNSNEVFIEVAIYKNNGKIDLDVLNSKFTGWLIVIGNTSFYDEFFFKIVERQLVAASGNKLK